MSEGFLKALRWYFIMMCAIIGTSAFMIADNTGSIKPVMIGILSYGVVYTCSTFWKGFRGKLLLISIAVFVALSFASPWIPYIIYIILGYDLFSFDPYYMWGITTAILGIPIMTLVFKHIDES